MKRRQPQEDEDWKRAEEKDDGCWWKLTNKLKEKEKEAIKNKGLEEREETHEENPMNSRKMVNEEQAENEEDEED